MFCNKMCKVLGPEWASTISIFKNEHADFIFESADFSIFIIGQICTDTVGHKGKRTGYADMQIDANKRLMRFGRDICVFGCIGLPLGCLRAPVRWKLNVWKNWTD